MHLHDLLADLAGFDGAGVLETRIGPDAAAELSEVAPVDVASVVHDSRAAGPGSLFCCIRGGITDGHRYAADAVAAGAVALLVEEWLPLDVPQARVGSVRSSFCASSSTSRASRRPQSSQSKPNGRRFVSATRCPHVLAA